MNQGFDYREQLGPQAAGIRLLDWLVRRYPHSSESDWRERLAAGQLELDAAPAAAEDRLRPGQWLVWRRPPWQEPEVPGGPALLYRDADLFAVAKPRGLPTLPGAGFHEHTLLSRVRRLDPEATPLHRLGRGSSGLLLLARTPLARRRGAELWRAGRVEKTYLGLVAGRPAQARFDVDAPIGPVPHPRLGRVHAASPAGRAALSQVRVIEQREAAALVEVRIPTGRPHQIRIHLACAGHPLLGDPLYAAGGGPRAEPGLPGDPGYHLHAWRLELDHPVTGIPLRLECPVPALLRARPPG